MSKRAKSHERAKQNARKENVKALARVPPRVLCKNLCGKHYAANNKRSKAMLAKHENDCTWAWGPDEETGVPVTTQETPAAAGGTGGTGMDVLMAIAEEEEETLL